MNGMEPVPEKNAPVEPMEMDGKTIELPLDDFMPQRRRKKKSSRFKSRTATFFTETLSIFHDHVKDTEETIRLEQGEVIHNDVTQEPDESSTFGKLQEDFEQREYFAGGGQGLISKGKDLHLHRLVAIKSLRKEHLNDPEQRGSFIAEARVTAQLEHPAILPIYSIHSDDDEGLHLAMKMVYGQDLKSYLKTIIKHYRADGIRKFNERKSLRFRLELFLKICDALSYAHSRNIMHCDLKPENIMIGEYHEAYLMDWGIARLIREPDFDPQKWTKPKRITGTPRFLTPEAIRGEHCDERADIYAMGLILYEIATLAEAYSAPTAEGILKKICMQDMRPVVHLFNYPIDSDLKAIILKASAEDREDRYHTVKELSDDLRKYLRNEEVSANPDSFLRKIVRWSIHHSKATMVFMLLCVIAVIGNLAYNLARQITDQQMEFEKKTAIGIAFHNCAETAFHFDRELSKQENLLIATAHELEFFFNRKLISDANAVGLTPKEIPLIQIWSSPGTMHRDDDRRINDTLFFAPRFVKLVHGGIGKDSPQKSAARSMGISFADGLNLAYSAEPDLNRTDPRKSSIFRERLNLAAPESGWSSFERFETEAGVSSRLVCSVRIPAATTRVPAVLYMTLDVDRLIRLISPENTLRKFAIETAFIDASGQVLLSGKNGTMSAPETQQKFHDPMLLDHVLKYENGYWSFLREVDGVEQEFVCVYARCQTLGIFYLEIYEMQTLIRQYAATRQKKN